MTESSGVVSLSPDGILDESDVIGYPFPNTEFKIIDINTQKETPLGEDGELIISGPNIMLEYLDEPEETKNTLFQMDGKHGFTLEILHVLTKEAYSTTNQD